MKPSRTFPPGTHEERPDIPKTGILEEGTDIIAPPGRILSDVMTRTVQFVHLDDDVPSVAERMKTLDVGSFPVCDSQRKVMGMITDRDLTVRVLAERRRPESTPVREVMSKNVVSCHPDSSIEEAEETMKRHKIRRLPVVDEQEKLVGYFTLGKVARVDDEGAQSRLLQAVTTPPRLEIGDV